MCFWECFGEYWESLGLIYLEYSYFYLLIGHWSEDYFIGGLRWVFVKIISRDGSGTKSRIIRVFWALREKVGGMSNLVRNSSNYKNDR